MIPQVVGLSWEAARRQARKFLPHGEAAYPQFVEEMRGIARGANLSFEEVWTLNCYEELTESQAQASGCTCLAVRDAHTADGHVMMAHNEDWSSVDRDNVYLVRASPDNEPAFLGMTYGALLTNIGFNAAGIGVAINSVYPTDGQVSVPNILLSRAVLSARTIGRAINACAPRQRASGYNYLLADANGEIYCVETSSRNHALIYGEEGWLVHTNHYLSPKMQALEAPGIYSGSHVRLNRARRLLQAQLGQVGVESLQTLLCDHVNHPNSICGHEEPDDPPVDRGMTLVSLVMDLTAQTMWAAPGPPCESEYTAYRL